MNIAIATDFSSPWIGGPATFIDRFCSYLASTSHNVTLLAPSTIGSASLEQRDNLRIIRLPTISVPFGYGLRTTIELSQVQDILKDLQPDVLQVHHPFPIGYSAIRAAARLSIPCLAINHTIPECIFYGMREYPLGYRVACQFFRTYLTWLLRQANAVCTPTQTAAQALQRMGYRRPIRVISNGIDTTRFVPTDNPAAARRTLGLPDKPIILYTGRLDPEKDMKTWLLAAVKAITHTQACLVIGGEGTIRMEMEQIVEDLRMSDRVFFPGFLPEEQLPLLYQAATIYCITSAVELQSITTLEAMSSGIPVVAADAGALPELIIPGETGFLAPPGDRDAFAYSLSTLLQNPHMTTTMGKAARKKAEQHSFATIARKHEALLAVIASGAYQTTLHV